MKSFLCGIPSASAVVAMVGLMAGQAAAAVGDMPQADSGSAIAAPDAGASRMHLHQGTWWYQHPNNAWSYYQNGQWAPYSPRAFSQAPASTTARQDMNQQWTRPYYGGQQGYRNYRSHEPEGGANGQPNDPFIRGF